VSLHKVHTVLTDNGTHFTTPGNTSSADLRLLPGAPIVLLSADGIGTRQTGIFSSSRLLALKLRREATPFEQGQVRD
jgi:hypothetical protein